MKKLLFAFVALAGLAACNPLVSDPVSVGGELEESAVRYEGSAPAWVEASVVGAPDHAVYALALVQHADLKGPTDRSCAGAGGVITPCVDTTTDLRMPGQRTVAGDNSQQVRLMTVWPGETVQLILVCSDETQELGCPDSLRTVLHAVDAGGTRIGALVPG